MPKGMGAVERLLTKIAATLYPSSIPAQQRAFLCVANLNHHQNKEKKKNTDIQESGTALLFGRKVSKKPRQRGNNKNKNTANALASYHHRQVKTGFESQGSGFVV